MKTTSKETSNHSINQLHLSDEFLRQVHRVVRSNNVSVNMDIEPTRNS